MPTRWHLYLIRCRDGSLYTGIALDVDRRLREHRDGSGAKYLRGRGPLKLVRRQAIGDRSLAQAVERRIKRLPRRRKEELVRRPGLLERVIDEVTGTAVP